MSVCVFCGRQLNNDDRCMWCDFPVKNEKEIVGTLPYGTHLKEYVVGNVVNVNGESTTYLSYNTKTEKKVLIKEFLPVTLIGPRNNLNVEVQESKQVLFKNLLMDFVELYTTLQTIKSPAMPQIYDVFEENKTAYAVTQNISGVPLKQALIQNGKPFTYKQTRWMLQSLFQLMFELSKRNIHHGGISDETVMVMPDETVLLTGFAIQDLRTKNEHIVYKLYDGFSAPEQYFSNGFQGTYTDIYAAACLVYYCVTGKIFTQQALEDKDLPRLMPRYAINALRYATSVKASDRLDSVEDFVLMLDDKASVIKPKAVKTEDPKKKYIQYGALGLGLVIILLLAFSFISSNSSTNSQSSSESQSDSVEISNAEKSVPVLVGKKYSDVISNSSYQQDYTFVKLEAYSNEYDEGVICKQSPEAGQLIEAGSTVYITVSLGPNKVTVPTGLIGISFNDAARKLEEAGIPYEKEYVDQTSEFVSGMVAGLSVDEGQEISIKETVLIVYVANDKPIATPTPSPTPTPTPSPSPSPTPEVTPSPSPESSSENSPESSSSQ